MDRTFTYHISPEESDRTITQYLRPLGYSRHILTQLKQTEGGILLNGKPAFTNVSLKAGEGAGTLGEHPSGPGALLPGLRGSGSSGGK